MSGVKLAGLRASAAYLPRVALLETWMHSVRVLDWLTIADSE